MHLVVRENLEVIFCPPTLVPASALFNTCTLSGARRSHEVQAWRFFHENNFSYSRSRVSRDYLFLLSRKMVCIKGTQVLGGASNTMSRNFFQEEVSSPFFTN